MSPLARRDLRLFLITTALAALSGAACGVKGPPLPPVSATPQQSDLRASPVSGPRSRVQRTILVSAPLDFFTYSSGQLRAQGLRLDEIADKVGTPCYVYSADAFLKPLEEFKKGLAGLDHLVCFAVKSNSNIAILKLLSDAGAGMDLVSGGELYRAAAIEAPARKIVFSGVGKTPGEMAAALEYGGEGILSFNVESVAELATLSQVAEGLGCRATVALRFNPDVDAKTHPYISTGLKRNKFGMNRSEIRKIAEAIESFPGIDLKGVSIHIGSQILSLSPLADSFKRARAHRGA